MKIDKYLVSLHAYLCGDGYVSKNPKLQKKKNYKIGLRNTNLVLLKDFQEKFNKVFGIQPNLTEGERCEKGSREIHTILINKFGSFHSNEWRAPTLNKNLSKYWLRTFFDCEGWVFCKSHQNRHIGLDSINEKGLDQIIKMLNYLGIKTIKKVNKKKGIFRIFIYGKENLIKFKEEINFFHPNKKEKLDRAIKDFVNYKWTFPKDRIQCKKFVREVLIKKCRIKKPKYIRIITKEVQNLIELQKLLKKFYNINSLVNKSRNGIGTIYYEMNINKKEDVQKLINLKVIPNIFNVKNI